MKSEISVSNGAPFRKGDFLRIESGTQVELVQVVDATSNTLTIKPLPWWRRALMWMRRTWRSIVSSVRGG